MQRAAPFGDRGDGSTTPLQPIQSKKNTAKHPFSYAWVFGSKKGKEFLTAEIAETAEDSFPLRPRRSLR